ncbi:MAG: hypothetical protein E3J73_06530 [Candidatus Bathyarchaeum sp.]|nr:MAG: hypothetical protein E3J73_06530 [Candidatus Bathyarchaeum sp.]
MVYQIDNFLRHPELLRGKEQHPLSLYIPLILAFLIVVTPLWLIIGIPWISVLSALGLVLYHTPQAVRIIRKQGDWSMILFPIAFNVRYFAWLGGLVAGIVKRVTGH